MYKKRDGTSGVEGQLYETKLISLIHFRAKFDNDIKDYNLVSNVSDIGTFDDICLRAKVKIKNECKTVAVFIQAKHVTSATEKLPLNSKNNLAKWFSSYLSIRKLFEARNKDVLFKGNFEATECHFVMYTNAKTNIKTEEFKSDFADKLNSWIGTGKKGLQLCDRDKDIEYLCEINQKEEFAALAVQLAKFLSHNANDNGAIMPMHNDLVLRYHVILVQNVLDVSEIKCKNKEDEHRIANFQTGFFSNDNDFIKIFKDTLLYEMLKNRKFEESELNSLLSKLYINKKLDITVLSSLIGIVTFNAKKFKLQFVIPVSEDLRRQLEKADVQQSQVNAATELALSAAKDILTQQRFKVPAAFGNKDLTLRSEEDDVEPSMYTASVIEKLAYKFINLITASPTEHIIPIEENIKNPDLHSGLAGTIGNILVSDDDDSKYVKFATYDELGSLAKTLYYQVLTHIPNLNDYKFHIKIKTFPKLTLVCGDENLKMVKVQVSGLGKLVGQFLCKGDDSILPMNGVMRRYHVLMAQKVVEISEIESNESGEHRLARFRQEFFESDEEFVVLFKNALYNEILKIKKLYENDIDRAVKEILTARQFKVSAVFGNKDLTIKKSKTERRLDHLKFKIAELITKKGADKIVTLDDSLGDGLLKLNGGISGIVGNILVSEDNTGLLKFTENWQLLGDISKRLYIKLQSGIENLLEYKFVVKAKKIPKLSFMRDVHDESLAKDFLHKLLFFTNQADERSVEVRLKQEILNQKCLKVDNVRVTADAVFLQYHDLVQRWWMLREASYLTKQSTFFEEALALIVDKPLMTVISNTYNMINIKYIRDYKFSEKALSSLKFQDQLEVTIVATESSTMTVAKMVQSLKKTDHFVFDLKYIIDLQEAVYNNFIKELTEINESELMLFDCTNVFARNTYASMYCLERLENIAKLIETKRSILIIKKTFMEIITNYFKNVKNIITDEKWSLIQMKEKSQRDILENAEVIFQGVKMSFMLIMDDVTIGFVEEEVLHKIMKNEPIFIGDSNSYSNYEMFERIYTNVGRYVVSEEGKLKLEPYIKGTSVERVLPCWGWKIKINLLEHNRKLLRLQTEVNFIGTLEFFCQILAEKPGFCPIYCNYSMDLEESNGVVTLKHFESDHWIVFELKMFLHFCNRKESTNMKMIFIFDCIDDIYPRYAKEVFSLLKTVKNYPCKPEIWISSRCKNVIFILQQIFNNEFEIHLFTCEDQFIFLLNYRSPA